MAKILNTIGGDQPAYTVTERLNQFEDFLNENAEATEEYIKTHAVQGPQGPTGATGAQGPQGPTGATGAQGERGNGIVSIHTLKHETEGNEEITTVEVVTDDKPNQKFEVHAYNGVNGDDGAKGDKGDKGLAALEVATMSYEGVPYIGAVIGVSGTTNRTPVAEDVATFILYDTVGNASYWCTVQFKNVAAEPYPLAAVLSIQSAAASGGSQKLYIHNVKFIDGNYAETIIITIINTNSNIINSYEKFIAAMPARGLCSGSFFNGTTHGIYGYYERHGNNQVGFYYAVNSSAGLDMSNKEINSYNGDIIDVISEVQ